MHTEKKEFGKKVILVKQLQTLLIQQIYSRNIETASFLT